MKNDEIAKNILQVFIIFIFITGSQRPATTTAKRLAKLDDVAFVRRRFNFSFLRHLGFFRPKLSLLNKGKPIFTIFKLSQFLFIC
jgi:hypothetical protein